MKEQPVSLPQMLDARERRALRQRELLNRLPGTLICFTMNIAGPVKNSDWIRRGFDEGLRLIRLQLRMSGMPTLHFEEIREVTGNEAFFAVDAPPLSVKRLTCDLEDENDLGRLFDIDVLNASGEKVSRTEIGRKTRRCLLCGQPATICGSRRLHSVAELQQRTNAILRSYFADRFADRAAELAQRSLLYEVCVTPKPGLVDRANSGAHDDMDVFTFCASAAALAPYFRSCARIGVDTAGDAPGTTFERLVLPGRRAEAAMEAATAGVNTHKGAIYSMGVLCAALGRLYGAGRAPEPDAAFDMCAEMTAPSTDRFFRQLDERVAAGQKPTTVGQKLYAESGIRGIRGEVAAGFPSVRRIALPALERQLEQGAGHDRAGAMALLQLLAHVTDTNMIARSDEETAAAVRERIANVLAEEPCPGPEWLARLDQEFIQKRLSPGGCADLLSVAWMAHFMSELAGDVVPSEPVG